MAAAPRAGAAWRSRDAYASDISGVCDILLRDLDSGAFWSASGQAFGAVPDRCSVAFDEGWTRHERRDGDLASTLDITVASDLDGELRSLGFTNHGATSRRIEIVSVMELVLGPALADASHPAFSKKFAGRLKVGICWGQQRNLKPGPSLRHSDATTSNLKTSLSPKRGLRRLALSRKAALRNLVFGKPGGLPGYSMTGHSQ